METNNYTRSEKQRAGYITRKNSNDVFVEFECEHDGEKEFHHPDYSNPMLVHRLCRSCHMKIHAQNARRKQMKKKERVTMTINDSLRERIKLEADRQNRSISNLVEVIITDYLDRLASYVAEREA